MDTTIAIVASVSVPQRVWHTGNELLWPRLQKNAEHVRRLISGHVVIVCPDTYNMLPRYLLHEFCIVVDNTSSSSCDGSGKYMIATSVEAAISLANKKMGGKKIFILGGEEIWMAATKLCTDIHVMKIVGDCHFQHRELGQLEPTHHLLSPNRHWVIEAYSTCSDKMSGAYGTPLIRLNSIHYKRAKPHAPFEQD